VHDPCALFFLLSIRNRKIWHQIKNGAMADPILMLFCSLFIVFTW
jgi:hypothetical protein